MEIREFAEQILFGGSLEQKLASPEALTDDAPGRGLVVPEQPGRAPGLEFARTAGEFRIPTPRELEQDSVRGRLLHFFANHELLATELMALVLLKFPETPPAFRRGVLKTLKDEQEHTRIYLQRLEALGVEFGQYPVNGFFWRMIAPMETPLAYVSRLALTFEQANLDYSGFFGRQFHEIEDLESAAIMDRIHRDEIGHVGYGLKWFRRWKDPRLTDWEAFEKELQYPLSPSRAKSEPFNAASRRRAGLDDEFINQLFVYSKSKGRTPGVYWFNPLAELFMARGYGGRVDSKLEVLSHDLYNLPQFLCRQDDVVLVPERPRLTFLATLKQAGLNLPQFEVINEGRITPNSELRTRKIGGLRPWAWCQESMELMQPLLTQLAHPTMPTGQEWESRIRPLYSKSWALGLLRRFLESRQDSPWLSPDEDLGVTVTTYSEAMDAVGRFRQRGHSQFVVKADFGSAGNGQVRLWEPEIQERQKASIRRLLETMGRAVVEPWLDQVLEFSMQWEVSANAVREQGLVKLLSDHRGQYRGSVFSRRFTEGFTEELAQFVHAGSSQRLKGLVEELRRLLESELLPRRFAGPMGIDAMIYRDREGRLRLRPIVEINPRFTMGRVALELAGQVQPGRTVRLALINRSMLRQLNVTGFPEFAQQLSEHFPLVMTDQDRPKVGQGGVCLNDPETAQTLLAVLRVDSPSRGPRSSEPASTAWEKVFDR